MALDGQQKGPFTLDQLRSEISAGRVQRNTLAWRNGMPSWTPIEQVPDLQTLFANVPPPLPKGVAHESCAHDRCRLELADKANFAGGASVRLDDNRQLRGSDAS